MNDKKGWHKVTVKNLAASSRYSFIDGDWIEAPFITSSGIRLIQTGNIGIGNFIDKNQKFISESSFKELNCKDVFEGDILICRLAEPIGRSCIVPNLHTRAITSVDVCILRVNNEKYDRDFIAHALNQTKFLAACQEHSGESTRQRISRTNLGKIEIDIVEDKTEQAKIAEVLSTVDKAISETEALIAKQQRIKTGLMQDLLTRGIDENGNLRSEETHQFKDSPLGRIPAEWSYQTLNKCLKNIEQGWSPDCEGIAASQGQWGVLKTTSVVWEGYQSKENKVLPNFLKPKPQYEVKKGDVLMTRGGPNSRVGVVAYVYETQSKLILSDKLYRLNFDKTIDPEFIVLALSSSQTQRHLSTLKTGLAESQTNISQEIVKQLSIALPPKPEQEKISILIRRAYQQLQFDRVNLEKLKSVKTGLMQDLLTGKKRVTPILENSLIS
jgi:type I restriction enzyme S subunit